jgi:hydroxyacylglutathione hydrolase
VGPLYAKSVQRPFLLVIVSVRADIRGGNGNSGRPISMPETPYQEPADVAPALMGAIVPVTPFEQNCSILWCSKSMKAAIVDPGGDLDRVQQAIETQKVEPEKILVTHGHMDHAGGVAELAEKLKLPIEGPHPEESFWIDQLADQGKMFGLDAARTFEPDRWLQGGDTVTLGETSFEVIFCPGHTPGHIVFYNADAKIAAVGDVLFKGSIGRTDFPRGDHDTLIRSIREGLWPLGDDVTFIPGHGPLSTFGAERQTNPFVGDHLFN